MDEGRIRVDKMISLLLLLLVYSKYIEVIRAQKIAHIGHRTKILCFSVQRNFRYDVPNPATLQHTCCAAQNVDVMSFGINFKNVNIIYFFPFST
jgi:hypothetical protein